jgi:hypothetical protein
MHSSSFEFALALNSGLLFCGLLVFEFLLDISEKFPCSMSTLLEKIVLLLNVRQLLMMIVRTMTYLEPNSFSPTYFLIALNY